MTGSPTTVGHQGGARSRLGIRFLAAWGLCAWAALACSASSDEPPEIAEGRALFEANCMPCHGEGARGDGPMASALPVQPPSILDHLGHHTKAQLARLVIGGIPPAMPPQPVTPEQVQLIVDYAWTLVPESEVAALRAMQEQMETMGDSVMAGVPGMAGTAMPGMDHSAMPGMDHSAMPGTAEPTVPATEQRPSSPASGVESDEP
jgi:mono/diheme cytochrome c family protein